DAEHLGRDQWVWPLQPSAARDPCPLRDRANSRIWTAESMHTRLKRIWGLDLDVFHRWNGREFSFESLNPLLRQQSEDGGLEFQTSSHTNEAGRGCDDRQTTTRRVSDHVHDSTLGPRSKQLLHCQRVIDSNQWFDKSCNFLVGKAPLACGQSRERV